MRAAGLKPPQHTGRTVLSRANRLRPLGGTLPDPANAPKCKPQTQDNRTPDHGILRCLKSKCPVWKTAHAGWNSLVLPIQPPGRAGQQHQRHANQETQYNANPYNQ